MDKKGSDQVTARKFSSKPPVVKKGFIETLVSLSGFFIAFGLMILGTGMICFIGFHNQIGRLLVSLGFIIFLVGLTIKLLDICAKIIGGRT